MHYQTISCIRTGQKYNEETLRYLDTQGIHHTSRTIFDSNKLERADFTELKVFHFKEEYALESEDSSIRDHYGRELRDKYFMAQKEIGDNDK